MTRTPASSPFWPRVLIAFAVTLVLYVVGFLGVEHLRQRKGPWEVTFAVATNGVPSITVQQPHLGIRDVTLTFVGTNLPASGEPVVLRFDDPSVPTRLPFGAALFLDNTFLPGTVTLDLFGNEIELLPRVLILNKTEHPWRAGEVIGLQAREASPGADSPRERSE